MLALLAVAAATLSACTPAAEPEPTPTAAFASEAEAFAAAEETYRAYTAALNAVDVSDPATYEKLFALSSGNFEAADREAFSELYAENYSMTGESKVIKFGGIESKEPFEEVSALVCVDVSGSDVIDVSGASVVPPERVDIKAIHVTFRMLDDALLIDHAKRVESDECVVS